MPTIYISHIAMHQCRYKPVRKPLGDKFSGSARKFPAAAFTRISSLPKCLIVESTTLAASSCLRTSPSSPIAYHKKKSNKNKRKCYYYYSNHFTYNTSQIIKSDSVNSSVSCKWDVGICIQLITTVVLIHVWTSHIWTTSYVKGTNEEEHTKRELHIKELTQKLTMQSDDNN